MMLHLRTVRWLAEKYGWDEVQHNAKSRVVAFCRTNDGYNERVNVYYTTGTVGTCIEHPLRGKTSLYRRFQHLHSLEKIFEDPRVHTGDGYYTRQQQNALTKTGGSTRAGLYCRMPVGLLKHVDSTLCANWKSLGEPAPPRQGNLLVNIQGESSWHAFVPPDAYTTLAMAFQRERAVDFVSISSFSHPNSAKQYNPVGHSKAGGAVQPKSVDTHKHPTFIQYCDGQRDCLRCPPQLEGALNSKPPELPIRCLAFGPNGSWFVLWEDGSRRSQGMPRNLNNMLRKRRWLRLPGVQDLSFGPQGEWFVRFTDGRWKAYDGTGEVFRAAQKLQRRRCRVQHVAFSDTGNWVIRYAPSRRKRHNNAQ